jgi:hypothetical protein
MRAGRRNVGRYRAGRDAHQEDEASGLAGWMYTDLLLGLAVVFLGSVTLVIFAQTAIGDDELLDGDEVALESTTTTSTLPPEQCTILYSPSEDPRDGFSVSLNSRSSDEQLASDFRQRLSERLERENEEVLRPGGDATFVFDELEIGIVFVSGVGQSSAAGTGLARDTTNRLRALFPSLFRNTVLRPIWNTSQSLAAGTVNIEVFPTLTGECGSLPVQE